MTDWAPQGACSSNRGADAQDVNQRKWIASLQSRVEELSSRCLALTEENEALLWELSLLKGPTE
jgi:hypothetical protein